MLTLTATPARAARTPSQRQFTNRLRAARRVCARAMLALGTHVELTSWLFSREFSRWTLSLSGDHATALRESVSGCAAVRMNCTYHDARDNRTYCFFVLNLA